jgi:hypothetical protein
MNRSHGRLSAAVGAALAVAAAATAAPITVHFEGVGPGSGSAGQYNWNTGATHHIGVVYTPHGNGSASATHFITFCIERDQFISGGSTYTNYQFNTLAGSPVPGPAMPAAVANALRAMWAEYRDDLDTGTAADKAAKSAAFQHAVWRLLDPAYNPGLGGAELGHYTTFLNPATWNSGFANLITITSPDKQDQLLELRRGFAPGPDGRIQAVPAPAALLTALVFTPAVLLRRRLAAKGV